MSSPMVEVDLDNIKETEMAVLFSDGDEEIWIPKSLMEDWPEVGESGTALVEEWFATKEGLI